MKKYLLLFFFFNFFNVHAQYNLSAGMGLCFFSAADMRDYINSGYTTYENELSTFNSSADFFIEAGYNLNKNFQLAFEYNFNIYSFNTPNLDGGIYDLSVDRHKPSIIGYYVVPGKGYKFKFGAGGGIRILQVEESIIAKTKYSSNGIGFLIKALGDTMLDKNLYALIACELRYDLPGSIHTYEGNKINFNSVSAGLKLGVSYYF